LAQGFNGLPGRQPQVQLTPAQLPILLRNRWFEHTRPQNHRNIMLSLFKALLSKHAVTLSPRPTALGEIDVERCDVVRASGARRN